LSALVGDARSTAADAAESKTIDLAITVESDAPMVIDVRLIRSALGNLLHNAIKYTHAGGHIALRARVTGAHAEIEVEDSCGGIPPGSLDQLFMPFVRRNTTEAGFGLGLAIAKQAIDAHGGTIHVQNLVGKGCIFVVELPLGN
ncbi:MAG TPA: HAMP domain-containing sensor histidine kinase, partial [Kofleriaceae bacterium]|nr:HAMP domain-containing sensor histidine kinase [Kofleriaceae bacterium]